MRRCDIFFRRSPFDLKKTMVHCGGFLVPIFLRFVLCIMPFNILVFLPETNNNETDILIDIANF